MEMNVGKKSNENFKITNSSKTYDRPKNWRMWNNLNI
jgi:hypothetical protein